MTDEERQRLMDFILNQHAQLTVRVDAIAEAQQRAEERWALADERWARADERWARTEEAVRTLFAIAQMHEREIMGHDEQIAAAREAGRETNERLNALIDMVERYLSERRNGNAQDGDSQ